MKHGKGRYVLSTGMAILVMLSIHSWQGYAAEESPKFMVFVHEPMAGTYKEAYPEIEELYASDNQLVLVTYDRVSKSGTHLVKVQIENANAEKIYDESKEVEARNDRHRPCIYYTVPFDEAFKIKLMPVFVTIHFSLDGKSYETKQVKYNAQNIVNKNAHKVIVLPFYSSTNTLFDYSSKDDILNTFADAIGNEIKRMIPEVIGCDITKTKVSGLRLKGCFENPACCKRLQGNFGEGIYIIGDISIPKSDAGKYAISKVSKLELFVMNTRTDDKKIFKFAYNMGPAEKELDVIKKLIAQIFYQEGLMVYIRASL
jgi:hypothetical protein